MDPIREVIVDDMVEAFQVWMEARIPYGAELVYEDGTIEFHKIEDIIAEMRKDFELCKQGVK